MFVAQNRALKLSKIHRKSTESFHRVLNDTFDSAKYSSHALYRLPIAMEKQLLEHTVSPTALLATLCV